MWPWGPTRIGRLWVFLSEDRFSKPNPWCGRRVGIASTALGRAEPARRRAFRSRSALRARGGLDKAMVDRLDCVPCGSRHGCGCDQEAGQHASAVVLWSAPVGVLHGTVEFVSASELA